MNKIPKVIHYCWFGNGEKPPIVKKCMESWKRHLGEYEIMEWNEKNFDFESNQYCKEAYQAKKFAFVSDYVRVHVLYHFGGIYLDTDVEVFRNFDDLLHHESFWGFEQENYIATSTIGAAKGNPIIGEFLSNYKDTHFIKRNGTFNVVTNVTVISNLISKLGLKLNGQYQELEYGSFFPQTYFSPFDYINCRNFITENSYCMHHFYKSWLPPKARMKGTIKMIAAKIIGGNSVAKIRDLVSRI